MIVSAINWLSISINLLLAIFVIVCVLMSMIILMQRPKNEGLGAAFGSGATDQLFGARTTNVLQKATVYLASFFFVLTLALAVLIQKKNSDNPTLISKVNPPAAPAAPAEPEKPASIAEEAEKAGEKPLEPEAATPPAEAPAPTNGTTPATPEPTPAPETTPSEQTPPPAEEQKAPEGQ